MITFHYLASDYNTFGISCRFRHSKIESRVQNDIHICVDSSRTVLEHHSSFIPSTLVSQLEEKKPRTATGNRTQDLVLWQRVLWPLSHGFPQPPSHFHSSFKSDRQPHTQTDAQGVYRDNQITKHRTPTPVVTCYFKANMDDSS